MLLFSKGYLVIAPEAPVHLSVHMGTSLAFGEMVTREGHVLLGVESATLEGAVLAMVTRGIATQILNPRTLTCTRVGTRITPEGYGVFGLDASGEPDVPLVLVETELGSYGPCEAYAYTRGDAPLHYHGEAPAIACAHAAAAFVRAWAA